MIYFFRALNWTNQIASCKTRDSSFSVGHKKDEKSIKIQPSATALEPYGHVLRTKD